MKQTIRRRSVGDPTFKGLSIMQDALASAGMLHTRKHTFRKNQHLHCRGCNGFVEFLSPFKDAVLCVRCGNEYRQTVPHFRRLFGAA